MTVTARFDGRVFVPDGPVDLSVGRRVHVILEPPEKPELRDVLAEVRHYCAANNIADQVAELLRLARDSMSGLTDTEIHLESDPESGESWLIVEAHVHGEPTVMLADYNTVLRHWVDATEARVRDLIRFTLSLA